MKPVFAILGIIVLSSICFAVDSTENVGQSSVYVPAVEKTESGYRGVLATLNIFLKEGDGHVFVDTLPLTEIDTQAGARIAKEAVEETLNTNLDNYDIFFVIRSESPIVGGPSAGGAMATALLAMVLNLTVDSNVVMTGTVNIDGSIGPVGGLMEKAQAVAEHNGTVFLIPEGQGIIRVQEIEASEVSGSTVVISQAEEIDLKKYAMEKWNLTVIEVSDIKDALEYFTGFRLSVSIPELDKSAELENVMRNLASSFINQTEEKFSETESKLSSCSITYQYERQLISLLEEQRERISDARELFDHGDYYSSSSQCFIASIQLSFIQNSIGLLESKNRELFLEMRLKSAEIIISSLEDDISRQKTSIDNINDIEIVLLSSERLEEAKNYMKESWKSFYAEQYIDSAYYLSYAEERANTVGIWLGLCEEFSGYSFDFNFAMLKNLTQIRISETLSFVTYAQLLGMDVSEAEKMIEDARERCESEDYSAALFNAIAARSYIDAQMELANIDENDMESIERALERLEANALRDVQNTQNHGILPIMAINYYEYAKSFEESDYESAMLYLVYSKHFAKASKNILEVYEGRAFATGITAFKLEPVEIFYETLYRNYYLIVSFIVIGMAAGYVIGYFSAKPAKRSRKNK